MRGFLLLLMSKNKKVVVTQQDDTAAWFINPVSGLHRARWLVFMSNKGALKNENCYSLLSY